MIDTELKPFMINEETILTGSNVTVAVVSSLNTIFNILI